MFAAFTTPLYSVRSIVIGYCLGVQRIDRTGWPLYRNNKKVRERKRETHTERHVDGRTETGRAIERDTEAEGQTDIHKCCGLVYVPHVMTGLCYIVNCQYTYMYIYIYIYMYIIYIHT